MKDEITKRLGIVLGALNSISVSGKQNLSNLSGSITLIEQISEILNGAEITVAENKDQHTE